MSNRPQWWVTDQAGQVLAGPFTDEAEAEYQREAEFADIFTRTGQPQEDPDAVQARYGVRRPDGTLEHRESPAEKAWQAHLHDQLARLSDPHDGPLRPSHPMYPLAAETATALAESGFELHHCGAYDARGGVCLTPSTTDQGVIVSWTQHDRQAKYHVRGYETYSEVQELMNHAVADSLSVLGFTVKPFGQASSHLVTAAPAEQQKGS